MKRECVKRVFVASCVRSLCVSLWWLVGQSAVWRGRLAANTQVDCIPVWHPNLWPPGPPRRWWAETSSNRNTKPTFDKPSVCQTSGLRIRAGGVGDGASGGLLDLNLDPADVFFLSGQFLNESRLLEGVRRLLVDARSMLPSEPKLVSMTTPSFGCSHGYHLSSDGEGCGESVYIHLWPLAPGDRCAGSCWGGDDVNKYSNLFPVVCPAGSFFREGACFLCRQGTYQNEEGRDFCNRCSRGSSPIGASSVNQCEFC